MYDLIRFYLFPASFSLLTTVIQQYFSFLLRIWQAGTSEQPIWRASLEDPHTHQVTSFKDMNGLFAYLSRISNTQHNEDASYNPLQTRQD